MNGEAYMSDFPDNPNTSTALGREAIVSGYLQNLSKVYKSAIEAQGQVLADFIRVHGSAGEVVEQFTCPDLSSALSLEAPEAVAMNLPGGKSSGSVEAQKHSMIDESAKNAHDARTSSEVIASLQKTLNDIPVAVSSSPPTESPKSASSNSPSLMKDITEGVRNHTFDATQSRLPFLRRASGTSFTIGSVNDIDTPFQTMISLELSLVEHPFLLDHAIGGETQTAQSGKVYLLPLMVALEVLAECASVHVSETPSVMHVSKLENCKGYNRLFVSRETTVYLTASGKSKEHSMHHTVVHATMHADKERKLPLFECDVVFDGTKDEKLSKPALDPIWSANFSPLERLSSLPLYGEGSMFHGPSMQSVLSIDGKIENHLLGTLTTDSPRKWFGYQLDDDCYLTHPLLLDSASQLVLYYLFENGHPVSALLPYYIESISFPRDWTELPVEVSGIARLHSVSDKRTHATVTLYDDIGAAVLEIKGIYSRRIHPTQIWQDTVRNPSSSKLSNSLPIGVEKARLFTVDSSILPDEQVVLDWCLDYIFTSEERAELQKRRSRRSDQNDWILGRIAAKDAVRAWIKETHGVLLAPADVEIVSRHEAGPLVKLHHPSGIEAPLLSISHSRGLAVALVCDSTCGAPGVDCERPRNVDDGLPAFILSENEQLLLEKGADFLALWTAKEASFKALGGRNVKEVQVVSFDRLTGSMSVAKADREIEIQWLIFGDSHLSYCFAGV